MTGARRVRCLVVMTVAGLLLGCAACASPSAPGPAAAPALRSETSFGFDIDDLETDHQFPGQRSTFHVAYQYRGGLQGAGYDPSGHAVPDDTYPYFQDVRDDMIGFIRGYPDKADFYEVFLGDIADHVMTRYPQLASLDLRIDVPAYGGVPTARTGAVHVTR